MEIFIKAPEGSGKMVIAGDIIQAIAERSKVGKRRLCQHDASLRDDLGWPLKKAYFAVITNIPNQKAFDKLRLEHKQLKNLLVTPTWIYLIDGRVRVEMED